MPNLRNRGPCARTPRGRVRTGWGTPGGRARPNKGSLTAPPPSTPRALVASPWSHPGLPVPGCGPAVLRSWGAAASPTRPDSAPPRDELNIRRIVHPDYLAVWPSATWWNRQVCLAFTGENARPRVVPSSTVPTSEDSTNSFGSNRRASRRAKTGSMPRAK